MSRIHYFQRYSQKENVVTNNTLLLFNRLYNNSPEKFRIFLNGMFEDSQIELDTTVSFTQQEKYGESIPDGIIEQESFKIIIETKLYGQEGINQIVNHWKGFEKEDKQIFLLIDKEPKTKRYYNDIIERLNNFKDKNGVNIEFVSTTFKEICKTFKGVIEEYDFEMKALIDDYEAFCEESNLIDNIDSKIRVVPTGKTYKDNFASNIYYNPSDRGYRKTKYIGLYNKKAVRAIGETICSVDASYDEKTDTINIIETQYGQLSDEMVDSLKKVIREAKEKHGYNLNKGHRFFFTDKYVPTEYVKTSKGGIMGTRYINLDEIDGYDEDMEIDMIADLLKRKEWDAL